MFVDVPEPVWNTSIGNSASNSPAATRSAAATIASACSADTTPSSAFTTAADALICASACTSAGASGRPEIGKFSTARCVCARHNASRGTFTSPIVSCSIRNSASSPIPAEYVDRPLSERPVGQPVDNATGLRTALIDVVQLVPALEFDRDGLHVARTEDRSDCGLERG